MSKLKSTKEFINESIAIHGIKYDYSKVIYKGRNIPVTIICPIHGSFEQKPSTHTVGKGGCPICGYIKNRKKIFGIGFYDGEPSNYKKDLYIRRRWMNILNRCYNNITQAYKGCTVCNEWLIFSNFKKWFIENYTNGCVIDKDIKEKGNKVYSPSKCIFIPPELNSLFTNRRHHRGKYPIGVMAIPNTNKFKASLNQLDGRHKYLGSFHTKEDAFNAYKKAKERLIKDTADDYFNRGLIGLEARDAMYNYKIEITD